MADLILAPGRAVPLGASLSSVASCGGRASVNFAVHASIEKPLYLCLFPPIGDSHVVTRDLLRPPIPFESRTGHIHHLEVQGLDPECAYALWIEGGARIHLDVRAKWVESRSAQFWGLYEGESYEGNAGSGPSAADRVEAFLASFPLLRTLGVKFPFSLGRIVAPMRAREFEWSAEERSRIPIASDALVIYEAHAGGLTRALSAEQVAPAVRGTFAAAAQRLDYLKSLGVNAVELLPIAEFNEVERDHMDEMRLLRDEPVGSCDSSVRQLNIWGYAPVQPAAFAPMGRYGATPVSSPAELKFLVNEMHLRGMECILDVVYNHVCGASCSLHFLGVDRDYFILNESGEHQNISGCGNTLSPNSVCMSELIMESLRWWVSEYHMDGFRLDAGGVFARDCRGKVRADRSVILDMIESCPVLSTVKVIVEPWDAGDGVGSPNYLIGSYPLRSAYEWFPDFGRAVRRFIYRGEEKASRREYARMFCKAIRGHQSHFEHRPRGAAHGVNYLSCHDGFALFDSAAYSQKTNVDGYQDSSIWNHGAEGPTSDEAIVALRARQLRNMTLALALARGTPMLSQGCEDGRTKGGNNNCYDANDDRNCLLLDAGTTSLARFTRQALHLREHCVGLKGTDFYKDLQWLNIEGNNRSSSCLRSRQKLEEGCDCSDCKAFVAWTVAKDIYIAFYSGAEPLVATLPHPGVLANGQQAGWHLLCNTAAPDEIYFRNDSSLIYGSEFQFEPRSACIAERKAMPTI